jgi:hypothetical protein
MASVERQARRRDAAAAISEALSSSSAAGRQSRGAEIDANTGRGDGPFDGGRKIDRRRRNDREVGVDLRGRRIVRDGDEKCLDVAQRSAAAATAASRQRGSSLWRWALGHGFKSKDR